MSTNLAQLTVAAPDEVSAAAGEQRFVLHDSALVLEPVAPGSWRVREDRDPADLAQFLAFIQEEDGDFEVMQVADTFTWSTFPNIRAALVHVALTSRAVRAARSGSDLAWLR